MRLQSHHQCIAPCAKAPACRIQPRLHKHMKHHMSESKRSNEKGVVVLLVSVRHNWSNVATVWMACRYTMQNADRQTDKQSWTYIRSQQCTNALLRRKWRWRKNLSSECNPIPPRDKGLQHSRSMHEPVYHVTERRVGYVMSW